MQLSLRTVYSLRVLFGNVAGLVKGYRNFGSFIHSSAGILWVALCFLPFPRRFNHANTSFCSKDIDLNIRPLKKLYLTYLITFSILPFDCGSDLRQNTGLNG